MKLVIDLESYLYAEYGGVAYKQEERGVWKALSYPFETQTTDVLRAVGAKPIIRRRWE